MTTGWLNSEDFYFTKIFEDNYLTIKEEAINLLLNDYFYHHDQSEQNKSSTKIKIAAKWRAFHLLKNGKDQIYNKIHVSELAPTTYRIIKNIPEINNCQQGLVYFSIIPSFSSVEKHSSGLPINARVRHQLCLIKPKNSIIQNMHLNVCGESRSWNLGKVLTFNDAYPHEVKNNTSEGRLVLLYDSNPI